MHFEASSTFKKEEEEKKGIVHLFMHVALSSLTAGIESSPVRHNEHKQCYFGYVRQ